MTRADALGDRMKGYEAATDIRLDVHKPIYARVDGRSFSRFTRGMERPYDKRMSDLMIATAGELVRRTHASIGYTQSDEISLLFKASAPESDILFSGRVLKLSSVLASLAASLFVRRLMADNSLSAFHDRTPHFDCRVFQLPNDTEAANAILWRWKDARKNALQMVAQDRFSYKTLQGKNGAQLQHMLKDDGVDFDAMPSFFKSGTFLYREVRERDLSVDELELIPERHRPNGPVVRTDVVSVCDDDFICRSDREDFVLRSTSR